MADPGQRLLWLKLKLPRGRNTHGYFQDGVKGAHVNAKRFTLLVALLLFVAAGAMAYCPVGPPCPVHDGFKGVFTGRTETLAGHLFGIYHCPGSINGSLGHDFLVRCD